MKQELRWLALKQIHGPTEDSLGNNIRRYLDKKEVDDGSQVKVDMHVAQRDIGKGKKIVGKKLIEDAARKMIEREA